MLDGLYPNVYTIVVRRTRRCHELFPYLTASVRVGLFTEQGSAQGGRAAMFEALMSHRPHGTAIIPYSMPSKLNMLPCARELLRRAAVDRLDLVHAATSGPLAIVAWLVASSRGLPLISSCPVPSPAASGFVNAFRHALVRQSRRLLMTSRAARAALIGARIAPSKIVLWRPGVDTSRFAPWKRSAALRERWGVSNARPAVIYAGELSADRGSRRLLSMELALHRTRPIHQLIVAGDGPGLGELQARCPNAIFMGAVPHAAMPEVLASADLYVCPSDAISTNLAVLEAQASGLPVVVMEHGSARERVGEWTARVCRSNADLIVETAALVRTDERRTTMALAAREYAKDQDWAAGLAGAYEEYRVSAASSRIRRNLEPTFIPQGRRF